MSANGSEAAGGDGQASQQRSKAALDFIEHVTRNADSVQEDVLAQILARNSETEYLRRLGLGNGSSSSRDEFKRQVPVVGHEDLQPFINRIANGETSPILCGDPITEFLTSSGTSGGERKLIPMTEGENERRSHFFSLTSPLLKQYIEGLDGKCMAFLFVKSVTKTPSGLLAMPALTSHYRSKWFLRRVEVVGKQYTSLLEAVLCPDVVQSMYCQLVCGLLHREEVVRMGSVFASSFLRVVGFLQERWAEIVEDIKQRKLVGGVVTDEKLREAVEEELAARGGPAAAAAIESECAKGNWQGILQRLWPRAKAVEAIFSGSMAQYVPAVEFLAGGLQLVSMLYASSECFFGLNLSPLSPPSQLSYTFLAHLGYFEFLPVSEEPLPANLVDLVDVEEGKQYELIVTTYSGLYRYRQGDVLQVTGFHHKAPQFSFVCRKNVLLAIDSDKTDEDTLHKAVNAACAKHLDAATPFRLVDYSSFADFSTNPGHYVLFWEVTDSLSTDQTPAVDASMPDARVFEDCCLAVEDSLDSVYRQCRVSDKSIGPLEIRLVKPGTFDALMDHCLAQGAFIGQYKTPRCVKQGPLVGLLNDRVIHRFFSPRYPYWTSQRSDWAQ